MTEANVKRSKTGLTHSQIRSFNKHGMSNMCRRLFQLLGTEVNMKPSLSQGT